MSGLCRLPGATWKRRRAKDCPISLSAIAPAVEQPRWLSPSPPESGCASPPGRGAHPERQRRDRWTKSCSSHRLGLLVAKRWRRCHAVVRDWVLFVLVVLCGCLFIFLLASLSMCQHVSMLGSVFACVFLAGLSLVVAAEIHNRACAKTNIGRTIVLICMGVCSAWANPQFIHGRLRVSPRAPGQNRAPGLDMNRLSDDPSYNPMNFFKQAGRHGVNPLREVMLAGKDLVVIRVAGLCVSAAARSKDVAQVSRRPVDVCDPTLHDVGRWEFAGLCSPGRANFARG